MNVFRLTRLGRTESRWGHGAVAHRGGEILLSRLLWDERVLLWDLDIGWKLSCDVVSEGTSIEWHAVE